MFVSVFKGASREKFRGWHEKESSFLPRKITGKDFLK
jgi:hypothetical protein